VLTESDLTGNRVATGEPRTDVIGAFYDVRDGRFGRTTNQNNTLNFGPRLGSGNGHSV